jgi:hypothetical protein
VKDARRFLVLSAVACCSLVALGATGAIAGQKLKTKSATAEADFEERASATATCKRGTKAVSGGFEAEYDLGGFTPIFYPDQSSRTGGRKWTSEAANFGMEGLLTSYVYCRDEKVRSRNETVSVDAGETETLQASCKPGTKAVSGGFDAEPVNFENPAPVRFFVLASRKVDARGWEVRALNSGDETGQLTVQVNCRQGKGLKTVETPSSESGAAVELEATCKRRQRVVSGGFAGAFPFFQPYASMKVGKRSWRLQAQMNDEATMYAYCEKK